MLLGRPHRRPSPHRPRLGAGRTACVALLVICCWSPGTVQAKRDGSQFTAKLAQKRHQGQVEPAVRGERASRSLLQHTALHGAAASANVQRHLPSILEAAPLVNAGRRTQEAAPHREGAPRALLREVPSAATWTELLSDVVGGTGASVSPTANSKLDQALLRRMRYQDKAVMLLLLAVYASALAFSASIAYRQADNDSPVTYYADPRYHNLLFEGHDFEGFLETFNQPPKDCHLQVTGLIPMAPFPEYVADAAVRWLGGHYRVAFSFALDLSPWMVRDGPAEADPPSSAGVQQDDLEMLSRWLADNQNDLACAHMVKEILWPGWEELAINIKSKIRQAGFRGVIAVRHNTKETVDVYKNRRWANFMHGQTVKVICALSLFGWCLYQPYMWMRRQSIDIRCKYRVSIGIDEYWSLVSDKLGANGFDTSPDAALEAALPPGPSRSSFQQPAASQHQPAQPPQRPQDMPEDPCR